MRKQILEKRLRRLQDKKAKLAARCSASTDVNEVRSLTEELDDVNAEIEETEAELKSLDEEPAAPAEETEEEAREKYISLG